MIALLARLWRWLELLLRPGLRRQVQAARAHFQRVQERALDRGELALDRRRRMWAADHAGLGFDAPTRPAPRGWHWVLDRGALDGVGRRRWRIQRVPG